MTADKHLHLGEKMRKLVSCLSLSFIMFTVSAHNIWDVLHQKITLPEYIEEYKPDLVTLDIVMPHLDGVEVLKKLKELKKNE